MNLEVLILNSSLWRSTGRAVPIMWLYIHVHVPWGTHQYLCRLVCVEYWSWMVDCTAHSRQTPSVLYHSSVCLRSRLVLFLWGKCWYYISDAALATEKGKERERERFYFGLPRPSVRPRPEKEAQMVKVKLTGPPVRSMNSSLLVREELAVIWILATDSALNKRIEKKIESYNVVIV